MNLSARSCQGQSGLTLIELVIAIVAISIVLVGLSAGLASLVKSSVQPLMKAQAISLAESYIEEISSKSFLDPNTDTVCPTPPASRINYDNVCDYKGIASDFIPRDQFGNVLTELSGFTVATLIDESAARSLNGINGPDVIFIQVTVTDPSGSSTTLVNYRGNYE